jgi:hypothetical protein
MRINQIIEPSHQHLRTFCSRQTPYFLAIPGTDTIKQQLGVPYLDSTMLRTSRMSRRIAAVVTESSPP